MIPLNSVFALQNEAIKADIEEAHPKPSVIRETSMAATSKGERVLGELAS